MGQTFHSTVTPPIKDIEDILYQFITEPPLMGAQWRS